jgi:pilus assembly protein FimV
VPRGDSLSAIAQRQYGAEQRDQAMIAIFRSNPQAFGSNINQLRAGSVLRLPEGPAVAAVDRAEARGEVRRQWAEWTSRAAAAPAAEPSPRLVLVPPGGTPGTGTGAASSTTPSPASRPGTSPSTESNRVQLNAPDIARVQQQAEPPKPAPATPPPAATAPAPVPAAAPAGSGGDVSVEEVTAPVDVEAEPAAEPKPPVNAPKPAVKQTPAASPSLVDRLADFWYVPAGIVALALLLLGVRAARRRGAAAETFAPFAIEPTLDDRDTSADTFPLRKPPEGREQSFVVEENSSVERTLPKAREALRNTVDLDEPGSATSSVDASGSFDQGDPLAEADFHMAYGLYDQAADLVKLAIAREPGRRDLKLKLLEVFFVWGNKEQFLQTARELAGTRDAAQPGEWEKVVIMGKQLAPEDPLFSQAYAAVGSASVDLNLEGGQNLVDFDLPAESSTRLPALGDGGTNEYSGLDFVLDDPSRGSDSATTQAVAISTANMKSPTFAIDGPTVEQPALGIGDTLSNKLGAHRSQVISSDQTAELAIDDLGLDLGKLESTGTNLLDDSQLTRALDIADSGAPTLVAGLDDTSRQLLQNSATQVTELLPMSDDFNMNDTSRVSVLDLNLENDATATTGTRGTPDFGLDLDVGSVEQTAVDGEYQRTQRIHPSQLNDVEATQRDLEPVSMSEVGTKLDLARAYMDMGDPDGARSILGEVLAEGSPTQRQEAQRLLDSIPG